MDTSNTEKPNNKIVKKKIKIVKKKKVKKITDEKLKIVRQDYDSKNENNKEEEETKEKETKEKETKEDIIEKYIQSMDEKSRIAFNIAKSHLGSSFDIEKSIGFKKHYKNIIVN